MSKLPDYWKKIRGSYTEEGQKKEYHLKEYQRGPCAMPKKFFTDVKKLSDEEAMIAIAKECEKLATSEWNEIESSKFYMKGFVIGATPGGYSCSKVDKITTIKFYHKDELTDAKTQAQSQPSTSTDVKSKN